MFILRLALLLALITGADAVCVMVTAETHNSRVLMVTVECSALNKMSPSFPLETWGALQKRG